MARAGWRLGCVNTLVKTAALVAILGACAVSLSGCGRRGRLEPPPDPSVAQPVAEGTSGIDPTKRRRRNVPIEVPKEPFFLDPIL